MTSLLHCLSVEHGDDDKNIRQPRMHSVKMKRGKRVQLVRMRFPTHSVSSRRKELKEKANGSVRGSGTREDNE